MLSDINEKIFILLLSVFLDILLGDPQYSLHPVIVIGKMGEELEKKLKKNFFGGLILILLPIISLNLFIYIIKIFLQRYFILMEIFLLYSFIAIKSLKEHAEDVLKNLDNIEKAKEKVGKIVGRDTKNMEKEDVIKATVESVAENTNDGIISPIFWWSICGIYGVLTFKIVNTFDSMYGHKKYGKFGTPSARLDDVMNFIPARITSIVMIMVGSILFGIKRGYYALRITLRDAKKHPSPNAGYPQATIAGLLKIKLGGKHKYNSEEIYKGEFGDNIEEVNYEHIKKSIKISLATSYTFIIILATLFILQNIL